MLYPTKSTPRIRKKRGASARKYLMTVRNKQNKGGTKQWKGRSSETARENLRVEQGWRRWILEVGGEGRGECKGVQVEVRGARGGESNRGRQRRVLADQYAVSLVLVMDLEGGWLRPNFKTRL